MAAPLSKMLMALSDGECSHERGLAVKRYGTGKIKLHGCPFQQDINDDDEFRCNCCEDCTQDCADDT